MAKNLGIIIIDKLGTVKPHNVKEYSEQELYKKCAFKSATGFESRALWQVKLDGQKYFIRVFAKNTGKANMENKYEFPPPIDNELFFGSCAVICSLQENADYVSLTVDMWKAFYEKLYGGFEDLNSSALEDEAEEDELANIPAHMKTKEGYLKDGFVVENPDDPYVSLQSTSASDSELSEESYEDDF